MVLIVSCYVANAETVITADQVVRGGKVGELKQTVDKAVAASPCVKRVFVVSRTGADVPMGKLDIPLEKVVSLPPFKAGCVQKKGLLLIYSVSARPRHCGNPELHSEKAPRKTGKGPI